MQTILDDLETLELIERESKETFKFRQLLLHQSAKDAISFQFKKKIHTNIAEWYELNGDLSKDIREIICYHWNKSGNTEKAQQYQIIIDT